VDRNTRQGVGGEKATIALKKTRELFSANNTLRERYFSWMVDVKRRLQEKPVVESFRDR